MASVRLSISTSIFSSCTKESASDSPDSLNLAQGTHPLLVLLPDFVLGRLFVPGLLGRLDQFGLVALCENLLLFKLGNLGSGVDSALW